MLCVCAGCSTNCLESSYTGEVQRGSTYQKQARRLLNGGGGVFQVRRSSERPEKCRATPLRKIPVTKSIDSWKPEMSVFFRVSAGKQRFNFLLTFTFLFCERLERYDVQAINSCKTPNLVCQTPKLSCSGALAVFSSRLRG